MLVFEERGKPEYPEIEMFLLFRVMKPEISIGQMGHKD